MGRSISMRAWVNVILSGAVLSRVGASLYCRIHRVNYLWVELGPSSECLQGCVINRLEEYSTHWIECLVALCRLHSAWPICQSFWSNANPDFGEPETTDYWCFDRYVVKRYNILCKTNLWFKPINRLTILWISMHCELIAFFCLKTLDFLFRLWHAQYRDTVLKVVKIWTQL